MKKSKTPQKKSRTKRNILSDSEPSEDLLQENIETILEKLQFPDETRREIFSKLKSFLSQGAQKPKKGDQK